MYRGEVRTCISLHLLVVFHTSVLTSILRISWISLDFLRISRILLFYKVWRTLRSCISLQLLGIWHTIKQNIDSGDFIGFHSFTRFLLHKVSCRRTFWVTCFCVFTWCLAVRVSCLQSFLPTWTFAAPLRTRASPFPFRGEGEALASEGLLYNSGISGFCT